MQHYGDITKLKGSELPPVDIITGGSPCQDLSVAGRRAGLAGERSGLFMEQIRIVKEMRAEHGKPRFMVWENVPGAFSSNRGEDFRCVLEETARVIERDAVIPEPPKGKWTPAGCIVGDGWSIAWRVHDAQYWGVPQRRKRICLLADFNGESAGHVLFELRRETAGGDYKQTVMDTGTESRSEISSVAEGLLGDFAQSEKQGEGATTDVGSCVAHAGRAISFQERAGKPGGGKGILIQNERIGALSTLNNQRVCLKPQDVQNKHIQQEHGHQPLVFEPGITSRYGGHIYDNETTGTLRANAGDNQQTVVYGIGAYDSEGMKSPNPHSGIYEAETARTLDLNGGSPACNQGGMAVVCATTEMTPKTDEDGTAFSLRSRDYKDPQVVCVEGNGSLPSHRGDGYAETETMYTLNATEHHAVCIENHPADSRVKVSEDGIVQTLSSRMGTGGGNVPLVQTFSDVASARYARDGRSGIHSQMLSSPEDNFVLDRLAICIGNGQANDAAQPDVEVCKTLNCMDDPMKVLAYGLDRAAYNQGVNAKYNFSVDEEKIGAQVAKGPGAVCAAVDVRNGRENADVNGTLQAKDNGGWNANSNTVLRQDSVVRRLTPLECERLQGFPDYWTLLPSKDYMDDTECAYWNAVLAEKAEREGKDYKVRTRKRLLTWYNKMISSDSARYKALGNSIALPFWEWMAERMARVLPAQSTMGSLFDGIGGFPVAFIKARVCPVWLSEIEEFPLAVTKYRFCGIVK